MVKPVHVHQNLTTHTNMAFDAHCYWSTVWAIETAWDSERGDPRQAPVVIDSSA
jgi:hypothetical protein